MASFSVVTNVASINAQANLSITTAGLQKSLNRLSSGFSINQASDDAAGLAVANAYRSDIAIVNQGIRNDRLRLELAAQPGPYVSVRLSPDGLRLAVEMLHTVKGAQVVLFDGLDQTSGRAFTFDPRRD